MNFDGLPAPPTITRDSRAAISPPSATRSRSRTRAKPRCRASPRCGRWPRADSRRASCRRRSAPTCTRCARSASTAATHAVISARGARGARAPRRDARRRRRCGWRTPRPSARPPIAPTAACTSRRRIWSRISTARSKRRRPPACCARSSPTRRAFACTTRCPPRRRSATKARPTTRALPSTAQRRASSSSSTAARALGGGGGAGAVSGATDARSERGDRAPHGLDPARVVFAQQRSGRDRRRRLSQRCHRGRRRHVPVLPRARVRRPARGACRAAGRRRSGIFDALVVREDELPVADAVATYLFNSQLLARPDGRFLLVAPAECRAHRATSLLLDRLTSGADTDCRSRHVRSAPKHAQRRRTGVPAAARAVDAARARGDLARTSSSTHRSTRHSRPGSGGTIATGSRRPTSATPRCWTNRGARSTN